MPSNTFAASRKRFDTLLAEFRDVEAENFDPDKKLLMQRIAESDEAAEIFAEVQDDNTAKRLLSLCVEAHRLAVNFENIIADAKRKLKEAPEYERAIATVTTLLKEARTPPVNHLTAYTLPDPERTELESKALNSINDRLAVRTRIAKETILRLGTTRKSRGNKAAETAAIGWIAEGVKRITKRTNAPLSADLAQLVLGHEVSLDQVHNAAETRKREWRV